MSENCDVLSHFDLKRDWCESKRSELRWYSKHSRTGSLAKNLVTQLDTLHEHRATIIVLDAVSALEQRFHEQAEKWSLETAHVSSPSQMMMHPSYIAVLGMANENPARLVTLMLQDLRDNRRPWFWALSYLTKENPIKSSDAGKLDRMIQAWVDWGKRTGRI